MDKEYFIEINGRQIPVSKEVYYAFKRPAWRERKRRQVRAEKELSLEAFADAGFEIPSGQALVDEIVEDKLLLDMLSKALSELTEEERVLIDELFFNDKSEREIAREIGVSQPAIHKRRNRILEKLKKLMT
ncbi:MULTISPECIES: RNA polymerase sigma factor [Clostridia]|jgi:RNA polymerase sigma factor (sigma-70 family)|uniref:RNA polymerase sigma factor, sigma-70 family n=2 Tax=Oscillospiraceae TaxID=216572 RepID=G8M0V3_ACECE|nr:MULTISPECIES: sigma-70 family RNA polymerase sigma factor [Oscillospiraceae]AEV70196.1 RNA polymerase sigma factor, sigma-70 family [Acetivibrio clariflavus DSM 19732]WHE06223.1 sigma-70 family RNA polymerase sigma factor [Thermoanaerobacterium thermosaccharolyticum]SHI86653.1 RNA polymerase sigma factor, sigma-70 family [Thermoclostridium caenicola]